MTDSSAFPCGRKIGKKVQCDCDLLIAQVSAQNLYYYLFDQVIQLYCFLVRYLFLEEPPHFVNDVANGHAVSENPLDCCPCLNDVRLFTRQPVERSSRVSHDSRQGLNDFVGN